MNELRLCSCGRKPELRIYNGIDHSGWGKSYLSYHIECPKCGRKSKHFNEIDHTEPRKKAIEDWNTRACTSRYIDAVRLVEVLEKNFAHSGSFSVLKVLIDAQPDAYVERIHEATWEVTGGCVEDGYVEMRCSRCHYTTVFTEENDVHIRCPHCGAYMNLLKRDL